MLVNLIVLMGLYMSEKYLYSKSSAGLLWVYSVATIYCSGLEAFKVAYVCSMHII